MAEVFVDSRRFEVLPMLEAEGRGNMLPCPCLGADSEYDSGHRSESDPGLEKDPGLARGSSGTCPALKCSAGGNWPALLGVPSDKCPTRGLVHWEVKDSLHKPKRQ